MSRLFVVWVGLQDADVCAWFVGAHEIHLHVFALWVVGRWFVVEGSSWASCSSVVLPLGGSLRRSSLLLPDGKPDPGSSGARGRVSGSVVGLAASVLRSGRNS